MSPVEQIPTVLQGRGLVVVDVEGNGQQPPEIIEIAALTVDQGAATTDLRSWLIRPQRPITAMVTSKVHGIRNKDVASSPAWPEVAGQVADVLTDRILVAHNAYVERRVLGTHLPDWQPPLVLDTLRLAKQVWPDLAGYGLDKLIDHAAIDTSAFADVGHHRAAYDTWSAWQLLCRLVADSGLDWPGLVTAAALPGSAAVDNQDGQLW